MGGRLHLLLMKWIMPGTGARGFVQALNIPRMEEAAQSIELHRHGVTGLN